MTNTALRRIADQLGFGHFEDADDFDDLRCEVVVRRIIRDMLQDLGEMKTSLEAIDAQRARVQAAKEFVKREL